MWQTINIDLQKFVDLFKIEVKTQLFEKKQNGSTNAPIMTRMTKKMKPLELNYRKLNNEIHTIRV